MGDACCAGSKRKGEGRLATKGKLVVDDHGRSQGAGHRPQAKVGGGSAVLDWELGNGGLIGMLGTGNAEEVHTVQDPLGPAWNRQGRVRIDG